MKTVITITVITIAIITFITAGDNNKQDINITSWEQMTEVEKIDAIKRGNAVEQSAIDEAIKSGAIVVEEQTW